MGRLDMAGARFAAALEGLERAATPLVEAAGSADGSKAKIAEVAGGCGVDTALLHRFWQQIK